MLFHLLKKPSQKGEENLSNIMFITFEIPQLSSCDLMRISKVRVDLLKSL